MANHVQLNNIEHADLKVIVDRSAEYGDNVWSALTFPGEFRAVQAYYPIFFQKDERNGQYMALALFGFEKGENLFLKEGGWAANYIPMTVTREPFLIGRVERVDEFGKPVEERVVHVDLDSPRLSREQGVPLFTELGAESLYLERIARSLEAIHQGLTQASLFFEQLEALGLIEPLTLEITLNSGAKHQLVGLGTINEEKLAELDADQLAQLHKAGFLASIYMVLSSQSHMNELIEERNRREQTAEA